MCWNPTSPFSAVQRAPTLPAAASFRQGIALPPLAEAASSFTPSFSSPLAAGCLTFPGGSHRRTEPCPIPNGFKPKAFTGEVTEASFWEQNPAISYQWLVIPLHSPVLGHLECCRLSSGKLAPYWVLPGLLSGLGLNSLPLEATTQEVTPILLGALAQRSV